MIDWASVAWIIGMIAFVRGLMWLSEIGALFVAAILGHDE